MTALITFRANMPNLLEIIEGGKVKANFLVSDDKASIANMLALLGYGSLPIDAKYIGRNGVTRAL